MKSSFAVVPLALLLASPLVSAAQEPQLNISLPHTTGITNPGGPIRTDLTDITAPPTGAPTPTGTDTDTDIDTGTDTDLETDTTSYPNATATPQITGNATHSKTSAAPTGGSKFS